MDIFKHLLEAQTETEFFVVLSDLLSAGPVAKVRSYMSSVYENSEFGLRMTLEQTLRYAASDGNHLRIENTHIFTLYQSGRLTWWMKDTDMITGLKDIQIALGRLRQSVEPDALR